MRKIRTLSAAAGIGALMLLAPLTASASVAPHYTQNCATGQVTTAFPNVPILSASDLSQVIGHARQGQTLTCAPGVRLSFRYTACDTIGAGYLAVTWQNAPAYTYQVCWNDR